MEFAKITARGQTTIPKKIRDSARLQPGDVLAFEVDGDRVVARKVLSGRNEYLAALSEGLSEWLSPEDEEAFRDL